ncbi:pyridoxamine 5'-phosphate oxidase family protein [Rhodobacter sp. SGA-6-6]|uniref:pyridoxamine 5'-phosphate oxidase family protein n=1 Tax=Rhodobacter sp. SGA-6-6 TaxID=2710882 RepID=UPI0013EC0E9C|nr:pyridoxamine 5'-phosphate oxidase family protein [Rhodobacter sp. SGA-6-6]NGM45249.1 pyridoxamine 5'-phosphate oxidase family protein [Rhodobacter sp. SGA-6-6]
MSKPPAPRTRLRRMHEKAACDRGTLHAILDAMPLAHVGHLVDGAPVVTPTLQWRTGDRIYWHGSSASRMVKAALAAEVCVTVSCVDGMVLARSGLEHSVAFRSAMVFGRATMLTDPEAKAEALRQMMERLFPGRWESLRPMTAQELKATAVLSLPLDEASAKIGGPEPEDPPEDPAWPVWAGHLPMATATGAPVPAAGLAPGLAVPDYLTRFRWG